MSCECLLYVDAAIADKCHQCNIDNHFVGKLAPFRWRELLQTMVQKEREREWKIICSIAFEAAHISHCYMRSSRGAKRYWSEWEKRFSEKEIIKWFLLLFFFFQLHFQQLLKLYILSLNTFPSIYCVDSSYFIVFFFFLVLCWLLLFFFIPCDDLWQSFARLKTFCMPFGSVPGARTIYFHDKI